MFFDENYKLTYFGFSQIILAHIIKIVLPILAAKREKTLSPRADPKRKSVRETQSLCPTEIFYDLILSKNNVIKSLLR